MSGISTHTHTKYIIPKTGAKCNSPAPKKRKKHPDLPECFSHRPAAMPQQVGQAHRSAPHKIPHKSPALPDFYTSARAAAARPRPLCGREGVIAPGFSGTGGVSKGDSVPLGRAGQICGSRLTSSSAAIAASAPLLPAFVPARSIACSMFSVVMTPNVTGTPVWRPTCAMPLAVSLHTSS